MKNRMVWFVLIGLVLGVVGGFFIPEIMRNLSFIGTIYINLLKFLMVPIVMTSVIVAINKTKNTNGKMIVKMIALFALMFLITFLLTSLIASLLKLGDEFSFEKVEWKGDVSNISISETVVNLFPSNSITMIQSNAIFAVILFSITFGIASGKVQKGDKIIEMIDVVKNIFYKVLEYVLYLTPFATFSLVGLMVADYGSKIIGTGFVYIGIAYLCSLIAMIFVMILPALIIGKIHLFDYMKKMSKIWLMTLTTCSSSATLPTTIKVCKESFNVPDKITDIVVPLGCTIHMCGGAVSFALLGIFCSQMYSISITPILFAEMMLSAMLINMAAPGIPNGGIVIGATYLSMFGIPLEFIGFYSGIYKLLDMVYTTLNVSGDVTANIILAKEEKAI